VKKRRLLMIVLALIAVSCHQSRPAIVSQTAFLPGRVVETKIPLGLPPLSFETENRPTMESVALGRKLFFEVRLSSDDTLSCAGCHRPAQHFTDGRQFALGVNHQMGTRNTPTVLNAAYNLAQFWDGRAEGLEAQALGPIASSKEMNLPHQLCVEKLSADAAYRAEFASVFGAGEITMEKVVKAIASFERTLLSGNSPFDRYQYGGERSALSSSAVRGLAVFTDKNKGNCSTCHRIEEKFALFTDHKFHNIGAGMNAAGELTDLGRFHQTKQENDRGMFRTPSLRNVALTAPYMHDGSLKSLKEVLDFYVGGGNSNPQLDREIRPLKLAAQEKNDLIAFLESLTGELPSGALPHPTK
jgi:cytochrome c peroxidase